MSKKSHQNKCNIYLQFFGSEQGLEILEELKKLNGPSFSDDTHMTAYREGRRSVYLDIVRFIKNADDFNQDMEKIL